MRIVFYARGRGMGPDLDLDVLLRIGNGDLPSSLLGYRLSRRFCAAVEWVWVRWRGCSLGGDPTIRTMKKKHNTNNTNDTF